MKIAIYPMLVLSQITTCDRTLYIGRIAEAFFFFFKQKTAYEIRPAQEEVQEWRKVYVYDSARYSNAPLAFYLEAGTHTVTIQGVREPMYLASVTVRAEDGIRPYSEVKAEYAQKGYSAAAGEPESYT